MQIVVTFEYNGDKVRLAKPPQGDSFVPVGVFAQAAEVLTEWADGLPVQLTPLKPPKRAQKGLENQCQPEPPTHE